MAWPSADIDTTGMDADSDSLPRVAIQSMATAVNNIRTARGAADGIASLDAGGKIPAGQLPSVGTVQVSSNDTTPGYLNGKLVAGAGITFTEGSDGANETLTLAASPTSGTKITASGALVDFTAIPAGVKEIVVLFQGLSTNGTANPLVRLGTSSGVESTGYLGASTSVGASASTANATDGFRLNLGSAANVIHGALVLRLIDAASNAWVASGTFALSNTNITTTLAGSKSLAGTLDRVRITTSNGTDTFDAGAINILYQ